MYFNPEHCPKCAETPESWNYYSKGLKGDNWYIKRGYYKTKYNGQKVPRYQCRRCKKLFGSRTHLPNYRHKKPKMNQLIYRWYCSGTTQNRIAKNLGLHRRTVSRKLLYLGRLAQNVHDARIKLGLFKTNHIQFDEMETFEHTIRKPVSIAIAVCSHTGHIIDTSVATIKSHGKGTEKATEKYGYRPDTRDAAREDVLLAIKKVKHPFSTIVTDKNPAYLPEFRRLLPEDKLIQVKASDKKSKSIRRNDNDSLWRVNHVCAKLRSDLARLSRRTWSTTKKTWSLQASLNIYMAYNNGYKLI